MSLDKNIPQEKIEAATAPPPSTSTETQPAQKIAMLSATAAKIKTTTASWLPTRIALPSKRGALMAASLTAAVAIGAGIGALGAMRMAGPAVVLQSAAPSDQGQNVQAALEQLGRDVTTLKASIEASNRLATTQITKISERVDRSHPEPSAKLAALAESVSRIEQRIAAAPAQDITGSVPEKPAAAKEPPKPVVLEGWVIRDIYRGRALVENRYGLYEVAPGANLPGVGRVETITQQNGRWVVVTPKGLIVSMR